MASKVAMQYKPWHQTLILGFQLPEAATLGLSITHFVGLSAQLRRHRRFTQLSAPVWTMALKSLSMRNAEHNERGCDRPA